MLGARVWMAVAIEDVADRVPDAALGVPDGMSDAGGERVGEQNRGDSRDPNQSREPGPARLTLGGCGPGT
jgi:hypothetical protein